MIAINIFINAITRQVIKMKRIQIEQNPFDSVDTLMNRLYEFAQSNEDTIYFAKFNGVELNSSLTMDEAYQLVLWEKQT